ncbi:sodium:solute symporter [Marinococcus halophilus]|uniref:sodium:solute symporter n=1 Tax=Marinococcus halophilus TaxID=1371 RepID=UPI0009A75306|nr:sodium:solute symporter [Marinococcus halophilus]
MNNFTTIDFIVLIVYVIGIALFGAFFGKGQKSTKDYFLGGRNVPWWAIGLSVMATQASAITFIGAPGWGYEGGLDRINTYINLPLVMAFLMVTLVPFFYRTEVYTAYEYLERRFDTKTRSLTAALFLVSRGLATGVVLYAPALVLSVVTGWNVNLTIALMAIIAIAYTVLGGISAVIWTDVIQMFVLWLGAILAIITIVGTLPDGFSGAVSLGAQEGMLESLNFQFDLSAEYSIWAGVIGGFFLHVAYFGADQSQIQRVLTSKSIKESKMSLLISGLFIFPQMLLFLFIGILLYAYYQYVGQPDIENLNELFPLFVVNNLPVGITGLIIAGVFAAAMSSLDSALNSLSAVTVRDFYAKFLKKNGSEAHYLKASRWATIFWGIYATIFAFFAGNLGPVIETVNQIGSYFYGALLGVFLLAIFVRRANGTGAFAGVIAGMAAVWLVITFAEISWLYNNAVGAVVSVLVGYGVSLLAPAPKKEKTQGLIFGDKEPLQEELEKRQSQAEKVKELEGERSMKKWPYILIAYFFVTLIILYLFQVA